LSGVSAIIPTSNEAQGIGPTIREINDVLENPEILVIDANSVDGTPQIALDLGARVVRQVRRGKGRALKQILPYVSATSKYFVIIDGDFTYARAFLGSAIENIRLNDYGHVSGLRRNFPWDVIKVENAKALSENY